MNIAIYVSKTSAICQREGDCCLLMFTLHFYFLFFKNEHPWRYLFGDKGRAEFIFIVVIRNSSTPSQ